MINTPGAIGKIYLIGLMGSGKSTVGKILADVLGWRFLDMDHEIESFAGADIPSIFDSQGEDGFREYEAEVLVKTASLDRVVISCGGGIVLREENVDFLKDHMTVWLSVTPIEAAARLEDTNNRPLLSGCMDTQNKLHEILQEREASYREASELHVNSSGKTPDEVAAEILKELELSHV